MLLGTNYDPLSPAVPPTTDPTTTATTCIQSDNHLHHDLQKNHKEIMDVLNQNTRAIWCMEKTVSNQNQMRTWHHSCWGPTLINLALQYPLQQTPLQPLPHAFSLITISTMIYRRTTKRLWMCSARTQGLSGVWRRQLAIRTR